MPRRYQNIREHVAQALRHPGEDWLIATYEDNRAAYAATSRLRRQYVGVSFRVERDDDAQSMVIARYGHG